MATVGTTSRPAYVYDQDTDAWVPVGVGPHTHENFVTATTIDAKGDLLAGSSPDTVGRLPIGTNGTLLVADSTQTLGMAWTNNITVNSSTDAFRITQTGSGNSFLVEDSASTDSNPFVITSGGSVGIGSSNPGFKLDVVDSGGDLYGLRLVNSNNASTTSKSIAMIFAGTDTVSAFKPSTILKAVTEDVNFTSAGFQIFTRSADVNVLALSFAGSGDATFTQTVKATKGFVYNVISTAGNYTAVIADAGSIVTTNNSSATNFFINTNAAVPFATGTSINIIQVGTGTTTIQATTPGTTTVASNAATSNAPKLRTQFSSATAIKISNTPEVWYVVGDIV